jgi:hypothetical protein
MMFWALKELGGGQYMLAELNTEAAWAAIAIAIIAAGWIIPVTAGAIAKNWRRARESEHLALLKQSMIERGMSVDEIERVVNAGMPGRKPAEEKSSVVYGQQQSLS